MVGTGEGRNQKLKTGMFCLKRDQKKVNNWPKMYCLCVRVY